MLWLLKLNFQNVPMKFTGQVIETHAETASIAVEIEIQSGRTVLSTVIDSCFN